MKIVVDMKNIIKASHYSLGKSQLSKEINGNFCNKLKNPWASLYFDKLLLLSEIGWFSIGTLQSLPDNMKFLEVHQNSQVSRTSMGWLFIFDQKWPYSLRKLVLCRRLWKRMQDLYIAALTCFLWTEHFCGVHFQSCIVPWLFPCVVWYVCIHCSRKTHNIMSLSILFPFDNL